MTYDLVIKNGMVIDGTGFACYHADLGIQEGAIATIGQLRGAAATTTIEADGLFVAPGIIDLHIHIRRTTLLG
jgi:N-acyl-D-aspartate/D-glutamate deacylase